jgi:hypothetical protein
VKTVHHFFPDLSSQLEEIPEVRKCPQYGIDEIVFAGISLFLFKCGSRNAMDNFSVNPEFRNNYRKAFGHRLPDMDTVALVFSKLPTEGLEKLKKELVSQLLEKKVFDKWRLNSYVIVAIDGTGIVSFDHQHCPHCLTKTSKNGKTTWFHNVLEAKLVTANGFSISLCTEWIENPGAAYNKQDCERKAFERLAVKLKSSFPRLSICLCADGLYPNNTFFEICRNNGWSYIVTLKDGNLKRLWKKINLLEKDALVINKREKNGAKTFGKYQWVNNVPFKKHVHNWIVLEETQTNTKGDETFQKFAHLTNFEINSSNANDINSAGRLRWKIENQGFDIQKNHGYNICHKFCRKSYQGMKNFYQCCQIAHLFNQLTELSKTVQAMLTGKTSLAFLWGYLKWFMLLSDIATDKINELKCKRIQIQFIT